MMHEPREPIFIRVKPSADPKVVDFEFAIGRPDVFIERQLDEPEFDAFVTLNDAIIVE